MSNRGQTCLITEAEVPAGDVELIVRQSPWGHLVASVLLLSLAAGVPAFIASSDLAGLAPEGLAFDFASLIDLMIGLIAAFVCLGISLTCLIGGLLFLSSARAAFKETNWVLRADPTGLYVKLRSYSDTRLPATDRIVLHLPRDSIRRIRPVGERVRHVGRSGDGFTADDDTVSGQSYLEIITFTDNLDDAADALRLERGRYGPTAIPGVRTKAKGAAVSVRGEGTLRIDWKTKRTRLSPDLDNALIRLSSTYVTDSKRESEQAPIRSLAPDEREERLLALVEQGHMTDAVILARDLYGFNLTEAKSFLDDLQQA